MIARLDKAGYLFSQKWAQPILLVKTERQILFFFDKRQ